MAVRPRICVEICILNAVDGTENFSKADALEVVDVVYCEMFRTMSENDQLMLLNLYVLI